MTLWSRVAESVRRAFGFATVGTAFLLTAGSATAVVQSYSPEWAMSTMGTFPWVWTCVRAVAGDLAGLPLVAVERAPGGSKRAGKRTIVDDPALLLLEQPSAGVAGYTLRKQLLVDWLVTGNGYGWRPTPVELIRLHPTVVTPITSGLEQRIVSYTVIAVIDGRVVQISVPPEQMLHVRDISWMSGPESVLGESPIRCLHADLTMEQGSKSRAAEQAKRGRPDVLITTEKGLGPELRDEIKDGWVKETRDGTGAFVMGRDLKAQVLSWTPKEFDFKDRSAVVRDTVLADFEVPPARAGLTEANYGTQKQQMRTYWESLVRRAQPWNDAFSTLARPGVRIEHDFSEVEALQVSYSERQMRVQTWVALGATPADAAAYEGFDDAPVGTAPLQIAPATPKPAKPDTPQGDTVTQLSAALHGYLSEAVRRYEMIAEAAAEGVVTTLAVRLEEERLFAAIEGHIDRGIAREWSEQIVGATVEAAHAGRLAGHDLADLAAFGTERARRIAQRMVA